MYFIGVDLGTSAVKLLLMDEEGKIVNIVSREYPLYFPHPGWSEQKPEDWWEAVKTGIKELVGAEQRGNPRAGKRHRQIPGSRHQLRRPDAWSCHPG